LIELLKKLAHFLIWSVKRCVGFMQPWSTPKKRCILYFHIYVFSAQCFPTSTALPAV